MLAFRGSYLELMLALERYGNGLLTPEEEAVIAGRKLDELPPDDGLGGSAVEM